MEKFVKSETKKLEDYKMEMKRYNHLMMNFPVMIERTAFTGLFKVSRKIFIETIVDNLCQIKCLLTETLVKKYQNMSIK